MTVLTTSPSIRQSIRRVLKAPTGERIVAVAFVGADAPTLIANPKGLTIYCWPQPGGTNPHAIEKLRRLGARVIFVERLHAKVYWSRTRGAVVGSANLTTNALGDGGLSEAAVFLPRGTFPMRSFVASFSPVADFDSKLKWLHTAHNLFALRNPSIASKIRSAPAPAFPEWMSAGARQADWRLGWYVEEAQPPNDSLDRLEQETGTRAHTEFLASDGRHDHRIGSYTLSFRVSVHRNRHVSVSRLRWWLPSVRTQTKAKAFADYPYVWFAQHRSPVGAPPPFDVTGLRFRRAFERALNGLGGFDWIEGTSARPSKQFLRCLLEQYRALD